MQFHVNFMKIHSISCFAFFRYVPTAIDTYDVVVHVDGVPVTFEMCDTPGQVRTLTSKVFFSILNFASKPCKKFLNNQISLFQK